MRTRVKKWSVGAMSLLALAFVISVTAEPAYAQAVRIVVQMNGAQEVPAVAPAGTGVARLVVNPTTRAIRGTVTFTGLTSPSTAGHIHLGTARVNGPVLIPLVGGVGLTAGTMRIPPGTVLLPAQMTALRQNRLYLNIHSQLHLGGEIRGQVRFPVARPVAATANPVPAQAAAG